MIKKYFKLVNIANPIYDVAFKYMMSDNKVAKLVLSAIIGEEIISLEFCPTELKSEQHTLTVFRMDFSAKIRSGDGNERLAVIEIQKAKFAADIMRFRKYLGEQYASPENISIVKEPEVAYKKALPVLSIYFLGYELDKVKAPVIKVQREYRDLSTGRIIKEKEHFIESLTHDSFIIQIPYLEQNRQNELLQLLSIFDQSNRERDFHILKVKEEVFPAKYRPVIRRLQRAISDSEVQKTMDLEDEMLDYLEDNERFIDQMKETIEEKDKLIEIQKKRIEKLQKQTGNK